MMSLVKKITFAVAVFTFAATLLSHDAFAQSIGVKGKIRAQNGNGIPNATITARQDGKDIKSVRANAKGDFEMPGLKPGVYNVIFDAVGYQLGLLQGVEVKSGMRDLGGNLILRDDQGNQVLVNGSVFYKEGVSLGGAKVEVARVNADGSTKKLTSIYTNIQGEFSFRQPEGSQKLRFTVKYKGAEAVKELDVDTGAIYRFAVTLDVSRTEK
jgi:hypothetical protein